MAVAAVVAIVAAMFAGFSRNGGGGDGAAERDGRHRGCERLSHPSLLSKAVGPRMGRIVFEVKDSV
jgi:hypothetical protein